MKNYKNLLEEKRNWYKTIGKVYCPLLKEEVVFNSKGFHHLMYSNGRRRPIKEQMYKLGLLPLVIPVIKNAKNIYKYEKVFVKEFGKEVEFWVLRETVGRQKTLVKIILRRIGTGNITFFSVMKKKDKNSLFLKIKRTAQKRWFS